MKKLQFNCIHTNGLVFLTFLWITIACGEKKSKLSFPEELVNERTPEHILIEGTHLSIIPPPDFTYWKEERAFFNMTTSDSSLIIIQENQIDYYDYLSEFLTQYRQSHMEVEREESFVLNDMNGTFLYLKEDESNNGYRILMGDSTLTIFVMATYPAHNHKMEKLLFDSLLSLYPEKE